MPRVLPQSSAQAAGPSADWLGQYYDNTSLSGTPALARDDGASLDFDWLGSPGPGVGGDYFSVRWTQSQTFAAGTYAFDLTHDDGARLLVDGQLVMEQWHMQAPTPYAARVDLAAGPHTVTVEYYTTYGRAVARLVISQIAAAPAPTRVPSLPTVTNGPAAIVAATNVFGTYFNNTSLSLPVVLTRVEGPSLNLSWSDGPGGGVNADYFSAMWRQYLLTNAGVYRFTLTHDDGARLYVDSQLVLDDWFTQAPTAYSADVALSAGMHIVIVDYYHRWGASVIDMQINPSPANAAPTATKTSIPQPTATMTASPATPAPTATSTSTSMPPTPAPTATPTRTVAPATPTSSPTATASAAAPAPTPTATRTPAAPSPTPTATRTPVPPSPTPTATRTPAPPAATPTPAPATPPAPAGAATNSPQTMIDDATLPHEGCLDRNYVDGFSWQYGPDTGWWNVAPPSGYGALTGWFAITTDASPTCTTQSPVANVRVEVRKYRTYALANGTWRLVQDQASGGLGSALFFPNFQPGWGNPDVRNEPDGGQSWLPSPSGLWHGWPGSRASVPAGTTAVCSQYEARLVLDDAAGPDNRSSARMLAEAGFDWWQSTTSGSNDLGMNGRYKLVPQDGSYRWFNGCSAAAATLLSSPPPYE